MIGEKITTAVIASAGLGTRFLPETKVIQKELLPILNVPIIEYVVADCVKAGIERIILVHSERNRQIKQLYEADSEFVAAMELIGKADKAKEVEDLGKRCEFIFLPQPKDAGYGTAVPLKVVREFVRDEEAFVLLMGDDFLYSSDGSSEVGRMIDTYTQSGASSLCTCVSMPENKLSQYGVMRTRSHGSDQTHKWLEEIVEKPALGQAPSSLVNVSKYIFSQSIFQALDRQKIHPVLKEWLITDTLSILARDQNVVIHQPKGVYLDGGNIGGWLRANLLVGWQRPDLRKVIEETMAELSK